MLAQNNVGWSTESHKALILEPCRHACYFWHLHLLYWHFYAPIKHLALTKISHLSSNKSSTQCASSAVHILTIFLSAHQVWFKNRRAKFRKKQRSLQKEQLQKQKEASGEGGAEKEDAPPSTTILPDTQLPPPSSSSSSSSSLETEGPVVRPVPLDMELNVTSAEHSGSESATEDNATDKEDESKSQREEMKCERAVTPGDVSPSCKRLSPKPGKHVGCFYCDMKLKYFHYHSHTRFMAPLMLIMTNYMYTDQNFTNPLVFLSRLSPGLSIGDPLLLQQWPGQQWSSLSEPLLLFLPSQPVSSAGAVPPAHGRHQQPGALPCF